MNRIILTYVDDSLDPPLLDYLDSYSNEDTEVELRQYEFNEDCSYQMLLEAREIKEANCIVIDSKLFEEKTALGGKFSGEEFELILRRLYPYIEVMVVSSKEIEPGYNIVSKWTSDRFSAPDDAAKYYDKTLKPKIDSAIKRILQFRVLAARMQNEAEKADDDADLVNSITASLGGVFEYEALNSEKIDELVDAFKEIRKLIDDGRL